MLISNRFPYRPIERVTRADGVRHYVCPDSGTPLPSVTTVLSHTADKTFLEEWRKRVGDKKAEQAKWEATGLGTLMHSHLEAHVQGIPRPRGTNLVRQMAEKMADVVIARALPFVNEVWGMEVALHYPDLYAGTTDLVGVYNGRPAIMDYKSAKRVRTRDQIDDYMDQTTAYALAHNQLFGTNIRLGVVFMVDRDLSFREFVLEGREFDRHEVSFLQRLEKYLEAREAA